MHAPPDRAMFLQVNSTDSSFVALILFLSLESESIFVSSRQRLHVAVSNYILRIWTSTVCRGHTITADVSKAREPHGRLHSV